MGDNDQQLPIDEDEKKQMIQNQMNQEEWPKMKEQLQKIFSKETSAQWKEKVANFYSKFLV